MNCKKMYLEWLGYNEYEIEEVETEINNGEKPLEFESYKYYTWESGYNKANEWHYPSKGELPENNKLCLIQMKTGTFEIAYRVTDLCWKYKNTTFSCSFQNEIYAWKEIALPKESE